MKTSFITSFLFWALATAPGADGLAAPNPQKTHQQQSISRGAFLSGAAAAFVAVTPVAMAAGIPDANLKNYVEPTNAKTCYDRCLYECVKKDKKDKGTCEKDCSEQCATAEGQLTSNTPPTLKGSETSK
mmetsp:Transcript_25971/g.49258  ORF Transcript_25971/g.49258 Transcript_25971/m.49258 type:complete len:129 (+) Transcript_25971:101-487(+)